MVYKPVSLDLIDEGRFMKQTEKDFQAAQKALMEYIKDNGHKVQAGKAKLVIEITVGANRAKNSEIFNYFLEAKNKVVLPPSPPSLSVVLMEQNDDGEDTLFVAASGSRKDSPKQQTLCTEDGRPVIDGEVVNPETGEVMETNLA